MRPIIISISVNDPREGGWVRQATRPYGHFNWDTFDKEWIDTMLSDGSDCLTIGDVMYNVEYKKD